MEANSKDIEWFFRAYDAIPHSKRNWHSAI